MNLTGLNNPTSNPVFLEADSEMQQRIRDLNWANTALGPIDTWPQSLRTTLSILLNSRFPMFLFWGPEHICFYNDAYRPSFGKEGEGKHPWALGTRAETVFPEIWDMVGPQIKGVLTTGKANWFEDVIIPMYRNGHIEEVYWTYSMSPVFDESNTVAGVFIACSETAVKVHNQKALAASEEKYRKLFNSIDEGFIIIEMIYDDAGKAVDYRYVEVNRSFERHTGLKNAVGMYGSEIAPNTEDIWFQKYDQVVSTRQPIRFEDYNTDTGRWYSTFAFAIDEPDEHKVAVLFNDITEQKLAQLQSRENEASLQNQVTERTQLLADANASLQEKNAALLRSNQNLEEFAHAASHDLKEPIRKIQYFTNKLKDQLAKHLNDNEAKLFDRVENATQRMGSLVDDLLIYSHVSQRPMEKEAVDLNEKVKRVLEDLELHIQEKNAVIHTSNLPVINGYQRQLQQLLQNLISNAIKYSHPGIAPVINISSCEKEREGIAYHCVSVADNGIGFEPQYAEKIFQLFTRLHGKNEYGGTGVGLSIVKKVVENHQGIIEVESIPDKGATFRIYFPV